MYRCGLLLSQVGETHSTRILEGICTGSLLNLAARGRKFLLIFFLVERTITDHGIWFCGQIDLSKKWEQNLSVEYRRSHMRLNPFRTIRMFGKHSFRKFINWNSFRASPSARSNSKAALRWLFFVSSQDNYHPMRVCVLPTWLTHRISSLS